MISVYPSTEKQFADNGIKILKPLSADIRKEDNGDFYLDLKDDIANIEYYQSGMIVRVPTPWGYQGFRLSNPESNDSKITCRAYHLYFDTKNHLIKDTYIVDKNCNDALDHLKINCDVEPPFTFISDISGINSYRCVRHTLEEAIAVVIERWGGHLVRDNFNIAIRDTIGSDNGVTISAGKNLTGAKVKENWDNVITKILPVGKDGITLPEVYLELEEELYDIPYSKVVSFEQDDINEEDYENEEDYKADLIKDLREQALTYLQANKLPKVNYEISAYLKDVSDVGDVIYVSHPKCNIDIETNVIAIEYDCINEAYTKIEFGNFKNRLGDLIKNVASNAKKELAEENEKKYVKLKDELIAATNKIWSAMGDSHVIYDGDKILIVDTLPKEDAKNVIMINNGGIGFGHDGIYGTFNSAWTIDGILNMQHINVINLVADMIKGGTLKLGGENNENGILEIYDGDSNLIGKIDKNGISFSVFEEIIQEAVSGIKEITTETGFKFDKNGLQMNKTGAPTGSILDEAGLEVVDKTGDSETTQFYAGYVDSTIANKNDVLKKYEGQTVTHAKNLVFEQHLSSPNWRVEEVKDSIYGIGLGFFYIGDVD